MAASLTTAVPPMTSVLSMSNAVVPNAVAVAAGTEPASTYRIGRRRAAARPTAAAASGLAGLAITTASNAGRREGFVLSFSASVR